MKKSMIVIALLCSVGCFAQQNAETAKQNIEQVMTTYFNAVLTKDGATFCHLFALDSVSFYGVNAPETYQGYLKQYPKGQLIQKRQL